MQIFTDREIQSLRKGGGILRACLQYCAEQVRPGITTKELDRQAEAFIRSHEGATPGFLGYHGYPATLCTSINEQCVHGLPGSRALKEGDIIAIDCGVLYDRLYTDACFTVGVGEVTDEAQRLMDASEDALNKAVAMLQAGVRVGDISATIQTHVEGRGFRVVHALTGHGLGTSLHQFPDVPNFGERGTGAKIPANTMIAIEPIVAVSTDAIAEDPDGWTILTSDGSLSAHFEHSVLVLEGGSEVIA